MTVEFESRVSEAIMVYKAETGAKDDGMSSDAPTTGQQSEKTKEKRNYSQQIGRPFVVVWQFSRKCFLLADKHNGGITALATVAIVVLTIFYVKYSKHQWETMQQQLEWSERPWIRAEIGVTGNLTFDEKGDAHLQVMGTAKNVGHSVATGVTINAKLIAVPPEDYFTEPLSIQERMCDQIAAASFDARKRGFTLFPDDVTGQPNMDMTLTKAEIERARIPFEGHAGKNFMPMVVGCADYQFSTAAKHHQTRFIYDILCLNPKEPNHASAIEIGRDWPVTSLVAGQHSFGGQYAY